MSTPLNLSLMFLISVCLLTSGCVSYFLGQMQPQANDSASFSTIPVTGGSGLPSLIEQLKKSVVHINYSGTVDDDYWGEDTYEIIGSGVIYSMDDDDVYVLTNRHVVDYNFPEYYGRLKSEQMVIRTSDDDRFTVTERLLAPDNLDLAIVKFGRASHSFSPAKISDDVPIVGEEVLVIGMPEQLDWSVSKGIVSGVREFEIEASPSGKEYTAVQTDAAINPGNSGGGMFTMDGELVGINTWKYIGFDVEGLNFAISSIDFLSSNGSFREKPMLSPWSGPGAGSSSGIGMMDLDYDSEYGDNGTLYLSFALVDEYGYETVSDGTLDIRLEDEYYNILYSGTFEVGEEGFEEREGMPFFGARAATVEIPYDDVNKSETYWAYAVLDYTTNESMFTRGFDFYLPSALVIGGEDLDYYDDYYYDGDYYYDYDYKDLGQSASSGDIRVTLTEGGFYQGTYYEEEYSLFAKFENIGSKKKEVEIKDAVLVASGKQYEADFWYTDDEDLGDIYPGAAVERELLFYLDDSSVDKATLYLELRAIEGNQIETVELSIPFSP